jgi:hypothetical protein
MGYLPLALLPNHPLDIFWETMTFLLGPMWPLFWYGGWRPGLTTDSAGLVTNNTNGFSESLFPHLQSGNGNLSFPSRLLSGLE